MAGSVNKVILVGNLGADPETKRFADGGMIVNMRIATSETWRDRNNGERKERTEWHNVVVKQEGAAKFAEHYLKKGNKVYVEGQLQTRKWQDQSGNDRYTTEVVIAPYKGELKSLSSTGDVGDSSGRNEERSSRRDDRNDDPEIPF